MKKPRVATTESAPPPAETRDRLKQMQGVAARFKAWRPAAQVLTRVRAVPTRFPQVDRATRVGGWPIERFATVHGPSNHGKAQPVDEPVLTPDGWRPIGALQEGDLVIGSDGRATRVLGVFPQGVKDVFRVEASDGGATRCCAEHLWLTTTAKELQRGRYVRGPRPERERVKTGEEGAGSVKSLEQIASTLEDVHYLPLAKPVLDFAPVTDLPIDPYVLGLLLGDGSFRGGSLTFTANDAELHDALARWVGTVGDQLRDATHGGRARTSRIVGGDHGKSDGAETMRRIEAMGLRGHRSESKWVQDDYVLASVEQRLELLRGLMDTDGWVQEADGCAGFCSTSAALRDTVLFLARSLGGRASWYLKETDSLDAYVVSMAFDDLCPFKLERKASRWPKRVKRVRKRITKIERVGRAECVCIRVEAADSLYVTKDFIVTHNTLLTHGLGLSFLERGHFYAFVDAEFTTPEDWLGTLMGEYATHPGFVALRPRTFEETVDAVRQFTESVAEAREKGDVDPETSALVVVDSMTKLTPDRLLKTILKEGAEGKKGSVDGMGGRGAQYKAALTKAWLDELTPLLAHTRTSMIGITRESGDPDADARDRQFDTAWKLVGGLALTYDASLVVRVTRDSWLYDGSEEKRVVGERHRVRIWKTKVGGKDGKHTDAYVHTSNGVLSPEGFDRARDLAELAIAAGLIEQAGAWFKYGGAKWNGEAKMLAALRADPAVWMALESDVRALDAPKEEA